MTEGPSFPRRGRVRVRRTRDLESLVEWSAIGIAIGLVLAVWWTTTYAGDVEAGRCGIWADSLGVMLITLAILGLGWVVALGLLAVPSSRAAGRTLLLLAFSMSAVVVAAWSFGPDLLGRACS
jgi:hypothetical protein